jgi:hypothetical protein
MDIFGYPIGLTFAGEKTYKSIFGGFMTFLSVLGIISYFALLLKTVFEHGKTSISNSDIFLNTALDTNFYNYTADDFDFAF